MHMVAVDFACPIREYDQVLGIVTQSKTNSQYAGIHQGFADHLLQSWKDSGETAWWLLSRPQGFQQLG